MIWWFSILVRSISLPSNWSVTREWKSIQANGAIPSARHSHTAVVHQGAMYIYGGIGTGSNTLGSIFKYDFGIQW